MTAPVGVVVIGAGFAGLGAAISLLQAGIDDFVILERGDRVGGTWRDNTYPGAACDIPSLLYSYSFAPNPGWSRTYSGSAEILAYIDGLVERYGLERHLRFGRTVTGLEFDGTWTVRTRTREAGTEEFEARAVVMAPGPLANASLPDLRGIGSYTGHKIHSARWDHGYDFTGKRVAVVGTGASAVQIVPELVKRAAHVKVFQRTSGWVLPRADFGHSAAVRRLFRAVPATQSAARGALFWAHESVALGVVWTSPLTSVVEAVSRLHLRRQVKDRWLRRQLTPDHRAGCKRLLMTTDYYPALQRDNCKLITWPIATLSTNGIRTADGIEHEVDCIVFATGFDVAKTGTPFPITGLDGRDLAGEWSQGAYAYKSVAVSGYPNLFFTFGPNSGPGHNSALVYMESQIAYLTKAIRYALAEGVALDVRRDLQDRYNTRLQHRLRRTTWNSGCQSWYLTADGFNATMYPGFATQYARQLTPFDPAAYTRTVQNMS